MNNAEIQQPVGRIRLGRNAQPPADVGAVACGYEQAVAGYALAAVYGIFHLPQMKMPQSMEQPFQIGQTAAFCPGLEQLHGIQHIHVQPEARHVDKGLVVGPAAVHLKDLAVQQHVHRPGNIRRDAQGFDKIVPRAAGDDPQYTAGTRKALRRFPHGAVSPQGAQGGAALPGRLPGQLRSVAGVLGLFHSVADACLLQQGLDFFQCFGGLAGAGHRVAEQTQRARSIGNGAHGVYLVLL